MGYSSFYKHIFFKTKLKKKGTIFSYASYKRQQFFYPLFHIKITLSLPYLSATLVLERIIATQKRYWYLSSIIFIIFTPSFIQNTARATTHAQQAVPISRSVQFARLITVLPETIPTATPTLTIIEATPSDQPEPRQIITLPEAPKQQTAVVAPKEIPQTRGVFIWPVTGLITQYPTSYHMAIDIAFRGNSQIAAARTGTVEYAGCVRGGYGCHIVLTHDDGYKSLYGHLSELFVTMGQSVSQNQVIGRMGATGRATGVHLHFEIRQEGTLINPLQFL
jgi:murein DD-endopeptidase MepM/ murein hydrolase activator NlpD